MLLLFVSIFSRFYSYTVFKTADLYLHRTLCTQHCHGRILVHFLPYLHTFFLTLATPICIISPPLNAYYPRTPDYTLCSGVHVYWSEHSDSSFVYGFMILNYGFGTNTATTLLCLLPSSYARYSPLLPYVLHTKKHFRYIHSSNYNFSNSVTFLPALKISLLLLHMSTVTFAHCIAVLFPIFLLLRFYILFNLLLCLNYPPWYMSALIWFKLIMMY